MLALQQKTNQKLRDLEIQNEESRSLLLRSLLEKDNLSPELLKIKREETLRQIREQIQGVIATPVEAQPKVLEVASSDIAETVLQSQAALDMVKKVSNQQFLPDDGFSSVRRRGHAKMFGSSSAESQLRVSESAATLVSSPYKGKGKAKAHDKSSSSEVYAPNTGTGKTTWDNKLASLISPSKSSLLATDVRQPVSPLASFLCLQIEEYTYQHGLIRSFLLRAWTCPVF
jgi:protein HOOK3